MATSRPPGPTNTRHAAPATLSLAHALAEPSRVVLLTRDSRPGRSRNECMFQGCGREPEHGYRVDLRLAAARDRARRWHDRQHRHVVVRGGAAGGAVE